MIIGIDEIVQLIKDGTIRAITLDTSAYGDPDRISLEYGLYKRLNQFRNSNIKFIMSEIVEHELFGHMEKVAIDAHDMMRRTLKSIRNSWQITQEHSDKISELTFASETPSEMSRRRLNNFIEATGCQRVKIDDSISNSEIIERYFSFRPPFLNKPEKKNEFPDAFALMSLESWAKSSGVKAIVVSNDGDWVRFCNESANLIIIQDLKEALRVLNYDGSVLSNSISHYFQGERYSVLFDAVKTKIGKHLDRLPFRVNAQSYLFIEEDLHEYTLNSMNIRLDEHGNPMFIPIDHENDNITVQATVDIDITVFCDFSLSIYDSIDKEYVAFGSNSVEKNEIMEIDILITFSGNISDSPCIQEIEVFDELYDIYFGEIEPSNDDPYDDGATIS